MPSRRCASRHGWRARAPRCCFRLRNWCWRHYSCSALYDHGGLATRSLGATGQVAAVLLGADGMLAGGPVHGIEEVRGFVDDIADEIAASAV